MKQIPISWLLLFGWEVLLTTDIAFPIFSCDFWALDPVGMVSNRILHLEAPGGNMLLPFGV